MLDPTSDSRAKTDKGAVGLVRFTGALLLIPASLLGVQAIVGWYFAAPGGGVDEAAIYWGITSAVGIATGIGLQLRRKMAALILMFVTDLAAVSLLDLAITTSEGAAAGVLAATFAVGFLAIGSVGALAWRELRW